MKDKIFEEVKHEELACEFLHEYEAKLSANRYSDALEWWDKVDRFDMLKKYGYQDKKKPWVYRTLTDKGIYLMWCQENFKLKT
jgi:hypothetical protein